LPGVLLASCEHEAAAPQAPRTMARGREGATKERTESGKSLDVLDRKHPWGFRGNDCLWTENTLGGLGGTIAPGQKTPWGVWGD